MLGLRAAASTWRASGAVGQVGQIGSSVTGTDRTSARRRARRPDPDSRHATTCSCVGSVRPPIYGFLAAGSPDHPGRVSQRGNPVRSRDCPAAVSGNDRRHRALGPSALCAQSWEATASRRGDETVETRDCPQVRRPASAPGTPCPGSPWPRGRVRRDRHARPGWITAARALRRPRDSSPAARALPSSSRGESREPTDHRVIASRCTNRADPGPQAGRRTRAVRRRQDQRRAGTRRRRVGRPDRQDDADRLRTRRSRCSTASPPSSSTRRWSRRRCRTSRTTPTSTPSPAGCCARRSTRTSSATTTPPRPRS